jgi:4,5-dihydroxyphthalate decarboxylase
MTKPDNAANAVASALNPQRGASRVLLTLAMSDYDHIRDLTSGVVRADGIDLVYLPLSIEEIFFRFTQFREWEVSEMSFGKYASLVSQDDRSLTAIPVFPSRIFRYSSVYVRKDGPVATPRDLAKRRVGLPEWAQTAAIYTRGMLAQEYGIGLADVEWHQAGVNQAGRIEKVDLRLPQGVRLVRHEDKTLNRMLLEGELDAVMTAHPPEAFKQGNPQIVRLFGDSQALEEDYWRRTGIFPIMHVVALRRDVVDRFPWVPMNLFKAFEEAKRRSLARAREVTAPRFPVPWLLNAVEKAQSLLGDDFWPYGIEPNRRTLEAFLAFAHEQGVCHRRVAVEELFAPQLRASFRV